MSDPVHDEDTTHPSAPKPVVVKKYANRRLYNTESSNYITLENLAAMVRQGRDFIVRDAKTNEDITRSVLTQIIVEEEGKGSAMLPTNFLRQLIGLYGEDMQSLVPRYLEQAMAAFARQQEQVQVQASIRQTMETLIQPGLTDGLEEIGRQNLAMMERAMSLFSPFYPPPTPEAAPATHPPAQPEGQQPRTPADELAGLRAEIQTLRQELASVRLEVPKNGKFRADWQA